MCLSGFAAINISRRAAINISRRGAEYAGKEIKPQYDIKICLKVFGFKKSYCEHQERVNKKHKKFAANIREE